MNIMERYSWRIIRTLSIISPPTEEVKLNGIAEPIALLHLMTVAMCILQIIMVMIQNTEEKSSWRITRILSIISSLRERARSNGIVEVMTTIPMRFIPQIMQHIIGIFVITSTIPFDLALSLRD